jgi:hypothetical protein
VQKRAIRGGPTPSWAKIVKSTLLASLVGVALASFIAVQPAPSPGQATTPTGYAAILGGITAVSMLVQRRVKFWIIAVALITGAILSGVWWAILNAMHAAQWAGAADAGLCPIAGVAVAWLLALIPSRPAPAPAPPESPGAPAVSAQPSFPGAVSDQLAGGTGSQGWSHPDERLADTTDEREDERSEADYPEVTD